MTFHAAQGLLTKTVYEYFSSGVSPRPIALVATVSASGILNLAPFSFFNVFGINPPSVAFSPITRSRDGRDKDTLVNLRQVPECSIAVVTQSMVERTNLTSVEFSGEIDEFEKSGFTKVEAKLIQVPGVKEAAFWMECRLNQIVALGQGPGAGNLVICQVVGFHIDDQILTEEKIDPGKYQSVGRCGGNLYSRAYGDSLFNVPKPTVENSLGVKGIPHFASLVEFNSEEKAQLGLCSAIPTAADLQKLKDDQPILRGKSKDLLNKEFDEATSEGDYKQMFLLAWSIRAQFKVDHHPYLRKTAKQALRNHDHTFALAVLAIDNQ